MKKRWIILAAVLSAAIFREPLMGSIMGFVYGIVIGIPVYLLLCFVTKLIFTSKKRTAEIASGCITIGMIVLFFAIVFNPPASVIFRRCITEPIPSSVSNLKGKSKFIGTDCLHCLQFNIDKRDLDGIVGSKRFASAFIEVNQGQQGSSLTLTSPKGNRGFSQSDFLPGLMLDRIAEMEAYVIDDTESGQSYEYLFYDPNKEEAIYGYMSF